MRARFRDLQRLLADWPTAKQALITGLDQMGAAIEQQYGKFSGDITLPTGLTITVGPNAPEGLIARPVGSLYIRYGTNPGLYFKYTGAGTSTKGWTLISSGSTSGPVTVSGSGTAGHLVQFSDTTIIANGDLSGAVTTSGSLVTTINPTGVNQMARLGLGTPADAAAVLKMAGQYYSPEVTDTVSAGAATVDWNAGTEHYISLTAATTLTFSNPVAGGRYVLLLKQDATGSRTVTWPASVLWSGGTAPTLTTTASKTDLFTFLYSGALSKYIGNYALNF